MKKKYIFSIIFLIILSIEFYFYKFIDQAILPYIKIAINILFIIFIIFFQRKLFNEEDEKLSILDYVFILSCTFLVISDILNIR
ncbi:hypothetical protein [Helcococcus kunzii]|nr:hypothetical protein [Helcococcus kunzii]MCT1796374.1 hypothetical protein [Helcococcus kunzii]MCT1989424.1 hypothetical protein [Helcococcus kunzii]